LCYAGASRAYVYCFCWLLLEVVDLLELVLDCIMLACPCATPFSFYCKASVQFPIENNTKQQKKSNNT